MIRRPPRSTLFPTRRSSDLTGSSVVSPVHDPARAPFRRSLEAPLLVRRLGHDRRDRGGPAVVVRSEEHTSELQSRLPLVCRLLLEKKKNEPLAAALGRTIMY